MERITTIKNGNEVYAMLFQGASANGGARFFTQQTDEFQVGLMERPAGYNVEPHTHPREEKKVVGLSEFLYIEKGVVQVKVYDEAWKVLGEETLNAGDFLLFLKGGHSLNVTKDCRIIEVKQGPYPGAEKAKSFRPAT